MHSEATSYTVDNRKDASPSSKNWRNNWQIDLCTCACVRERESWMVNYTIENCSSKTISSTCCIQKFLGWYFLSCSHKQPPKNCPYSFGFQFCHWLKGLKWKRYKSVGNIFHLLLMLLRLRKYSSHVDEIHYAIPKNCIEGMRGYSEFHQHSWIQ